ncbi:MAG TPA: DUF805 domain-containing protein [Noviherbaspirillum sp.]|nr:DUF805 domain-containing protein [Noviherbaspirillum sp.]
MTFIDAIKTCFAKYADFTGRATRSEYWWFFLFVVLGSIAAGAIADVVHLLFMLATLLPSLAAAARRLHDTGRSGWLLLIGFIPIVGALVLIYFLVQPGEGANRFGEPLAVQ